MISTDVVDLEAEDEHLVDPACDPNNPKVIHFNDITSAAFKIKSGIINTPCIKSHLSDVTGMDVYLKKDFLQYTGSFKERGARYSLLMLTPEQAKKGVISASAGNHAQALSYHGYKLGISVTVVMPVMAPIMKIQKCKKYKANVVVQGNNMIDAKRIAMKIGKLKGMLYINGYDHPHIMAGQGTLGLEIVDQVENPDAIIVPVGGGGLIAGISVAVKALLPNVQIIGIESDKCPSFKKALELGSPSEVDCGPTLADGLAVPLVGYNAFETARPLIDRLVVVKEEYIALAILRLVELEKCVCEGAGASGLAAILDGQLNDLRGKRVVILLSGGNIDTTILGRCLERGLAAEGRLLKLTVIVSDRPGGIAELCRLISSIGVSIKDILHERAWVISDVFSVKVNVTCETRDYEHALELKRLLNSVYKEVSFHDFPKENICLTD